MKRWTTLICATFLTGVLISPAFSQTLYFDFGDLSSPSGSNYNNVLVNNGVDNTQPIVLADTIDSTGASTGIGLSLQGFFPGSNQSGTTSPSGDMAMFLSDATQDNAFGHVGEFGGNDDASMGMIDLTGLDPNLAYDFTFAASRIGVSDIRTAQYEVVGANMETVVLDSANNESNIVIASSVTPTAAGSIRINVTPDTTNTNGSNFYYIGAMKVQSIPEPSSILLLLLGAASVGVRRSAIRKL